MIESLIISVLNRTIASGTPLLLGTLGEITTERSGVLNLGVEGMMAMGAVTGFMVTMTTGSAWAGMIAGILAGAALSVIHAFATITLKVNQVVSGLALAMLGTGVASLLGKPFIGKPLPAQMPLIRIPLLADIPYVGTVLFQKDPFFYLSVILGLVLWYLLRRTRWGIRVRSVGENPAAAEVQGVNVAGVRYVCTMIGGALCGMGGAHLSLVYSTSWTEATTGGRGWIVVALTIFALWNPLRAFIGAFLFGCIFVMQYMLQPLGVPVNLLAMMPYAATLIVLVIGGLRGDRRHLSAPAALGEPHSRGEK